MLKLLLEHNNLDSSFFSFSLLSLKMADPSVNISLSAKLEINLSLSVLLHSGQIVEVTGGSSNTVLIPTVCNENLALTDTSEASTSIEEATESMADEETIPCSSRDLLSETGDNVKGPLTEEMMRSIKAKWDALFECSSSDALTASPVTSLPIMVNSPSMSSSSMAVSSLPMTPVKVSSPTSLPMCPLSLSFPSASAFANVDSPASPSFLSVDPDDLFWIPLPSLGENFDASIIESVLEKDGDLLVEIDLGNMETEDEDVVFLGEFKKV